LFIQEAPKHAETAGWVLSKQVVEIPYLFHEEEAFLKVRIISSL